MPQPGALSNRVAIVTGSGRGLGAATALKLARLGADIVINDLNADAAKEVATQIQSLGRKAVIKSQDVSNYQAANELVTQAKAELGRIDILVNNAGITRDAMLHKLTEENWDEVIRVNLKGVFNMGQACAKLMIEQKSGRIINIASVAAFGNFGQTNYSASKAGVIGLTSTWALELSKHQVTVNAVAPGFIETIMTQQVPEDVKAKIVGRIPLKKMGQPDDIANMVAFLASDEAGYVTGQCIVVDGGLTCGI